MPGTFDVFLSYNSTDRGAMSPLAEALRRRGLTVWFDAWELAPGMAWQEELEKGILSAGAAAICFGPAGLGPWEDREMRAFLDLFVRRKQPVIPVLLPGAPEAPELPLFLRAFTWLDLRSGLTEDGLEQLVWGITRRKPAPPGDDPPADDPAIDDYRRWASRQVEHLPLIGVGGGDFKLSFDKVYVPLRLTAQLAEAALRERGVGPKQAAWLAEAALAEDLPLEQVFAPRLAAGPNALFLGDPGAGKTTVLRKLQHQCLEGPGSLHLPPGTLPIFLRLRQITEAELDGSMGALVSRHLQADDAEGLLAADLGERLWERGNLLLLLDGLDEVAGDGRRAEVCRFFERELRQGEARGVRAALSSRFTGYGGKAHLDERFLRLEVRPLDAAGCRRLVERWFAAVPGALTDYTHRDAEKARDRLLAALEGDYRTQHLKVLIGSPLLLTLLCIVVLRGKEMPRQRWAFYDECLKILLSVWGKRKAEEAKEADREPPVEVEKVLTALSTVAWEIHLDEETSDLSWPELTVRLEELFEEQGVAVSGEAVLRWLVDDAGVIAEFGERYGFRHRGLQEYLAALHAASRSEAMLPIVAEHFGKPGWQEIPLLLCGLPNRRLFAPLVRALLQTAKPFAERALLLGCLEEAADVDLTPLLELLEPGGEPGRQAAVLWLLRGRREAQLLERAEALLASPDAQVAGFAERIVNAAQAAGDGAVPTFDFFLLAAPGAEEGTLELARHLREEGLQVHSSAAEPEWLKTLDRLRVEHRALALLAGPGGREALEGKELLSYVRHFVRGGGPVVPVLLPGCAAIPSLPPSLSPKTAWIDLRGGFAGAAGKLDRAAVAHGKAAGVAEARSGPRVREAWVDPLTGIRFLWIPGGRFAMGEYEKETVAVTPFWLAETPVTNRQYAVFLEHVRYPEPPRWRDRRFSDPEQPVVAVTWDDAMAFCRWLSEGMGKPVTLPTEARWQFAARGTDDREYPWGDQKPDEARACFELDFDKGKPAPVGSCPEGKGPFEALDQAGNVWEWCADQVSRREGFGHEDEEWRALRGGCWYSPALNLRSYNRYRSWTSNRDDGIGFRIAVVPANMALIPFPSLGAGEGGGFGDGDPKADVAA